VSDIWQVDQEWEKHALVLLRILQGNYLMVIQKLPLMLDQFSHMISKFQHATETYTFYSVLPTSGKEFWPNQLKSSAAGEKFCRTHY
jgi:hypothetical protein